jgi:hypothetical protein
MDITTTVFLVGSFVSICLIYFLVILPMRNLHGLRSIPCPKTLPVLGNALDLLKIQYGNVETLR